MDGDWSLSVALSQHIRHYSASRSQIYRLTTPHLPSSPLILNSLARPEQPKRCEAKTEPHHSKILDLSQRTDFSTALKTSPSSQIGRSGIWEKMSPPSSPRRPQTPPSSFPA